MMMIMKMHQQQAKLYTHEDKREKQKEEKERESERKEEVTEETMGNSSSEYFNKMNNNDISNNQSFKK